mgnify:CR=1 FL=1
MRPCSFDRSQVALGLVLANALPEVLDALLLVEGPLPSSLNLVLELLLAKEVFALAGNLKRHVTGSHHPLSTKHLQELLSQLLKLLLHTRQVLVQFLAIFTQFPPFSRQNTMQVAHLIHSYLESLLVAN